MNAQTQADKEKTSPNRNLKIKFIGVGGAGCNAADYLAQAGFADVAFIAVNTDAQALANCQHAQTIQIGASDTGGLSAGGDPDIGWSAAEKDSQTLSQICAGADIVFVAAGMGGGTGTGAAPVVSRLARSAGALVLAFAILPFGRLGPKQQHQALRGLQQLKAVADGVICLSNRRLVSLVDERTSLADALKIGHELFAQVLRGIERLLRRPGLINLDFANLCSVMRGRHADCSCATADASGPNRAADLMAKLLNNPWLEGGKVFADAEVVLMGVAGNDGITMAELNSIMEQINRHCENAKILLGTCIDESLGDRLEVTLIVSGKSSAQEKECKPNGAADSTGAALASQAAGLELDTQFNSAPSPARSEPRYLPPPPELSDERKEELMRKQERRNSPLRNVLPRLHQGQFELEVIPKGRFANTEPTIHHGEDLDNPTFIRRGIRLN